MGKHLYVLTILILASAGSIHAQETWEKTPYQNWTKEQANKILSNSAWAKTIDFQAQAVDTQQVGLFIPPLGKAKIMLRSALPVRQAMLRLRQIDAKYDRMSDSEKQAFDARNKALLECPACTNFYVVWISSNYIAMENKYYVSDRKKHVYLSNDAGERRELSEFAVLSQRDNELVFYFPRFDAKGAALIVPGSKKLTFNFELRGMDGKSTFPFEKHHFNVADITRDGAVLF